MKIRRDIFGRRSFRNASTDARRGLLPTNAALLALTLVELLVVIAIIALLAALLLPSLARSKATAQSAVCKSNLRQLGTALQMFVSQNLSYPVNRFQTKPLSPETSDRFWLGQLTREGFGIPNPSTNFAEQGVWRCPSARWNEALQRGGAANGSLLICYGYNDDKFTGRGSRDYANKFGLQGHYVKGEAGAEATFRPIAESEVLIPSEMMAIGDDFESSALFRRDSILHFESCGNARARHRGRANVAFCDGHVASPTLNFLFEDMSDTALARWNRDHQPHREKW